VSGAGEMTCRELVDVITEYLEGTLRVAERARFEEHLGDCRSCATYLDQMRATITALGELREESVSAEARAELLEAFRGWKRPA
jgi:anti-sigma factor RsiW